MSNVPTNLIPTRITGLPEYMGTSTLGYIPYILDGRTYKVQFGQIAAVGAVPSTRVIAAGTGLAGGGDLSENRVISIANGGVGFDQLSATGVVAGSYGSGSAVPVITVDLKGRVTDISTTPLVITGYVPDSRLISTGAGLLGGGSLASNRTLSVDFSSATPQALGSATAGVSNAAARGDHVHPAVNLSDTTQTQGALPLGRGGTGDALSPVAGAVVYSTGTKLALADPGNPGQVLTSAGAGEPYWATIAGTGTVTNVSVLTANGFGGTVAFPDTTPQITLNTTVTGIIKGDGTSMTAASPGVDYALPGANNDITSMTGLTGGISTPDYIDFDTGATVARATGRLWWDNADGIQTLNLGMAGSNATLQIGEEMYFRIKASSAITEGQVVMFTGTVGNSGALTGAPATGLTKDTASYIMGVATESIALNGWGYVTQFGLVRSINTTGGAEAWVDGQILYYDPAVAGGLTKNVPAAPNAKVEVAAVVNAASNGSLFVRPIARFSLGQLNDVETAAATNNDLLQYNGASGYWQHKAPSLISVGTATNLAGGAANRIAYQTGAGATSFITAPTVANTFLEWSGSAFQWSSNPLGTVTSVAASGGSTGLTFSGSPITTSGTLTLGGTLALASGGTGSTTAAGARTNLGLGTAAVLNAGVANGVATLDSAGTVPTSQLPAAVLGALNYQGTWNASTNTPTLTSSVGTKGYYYVVDVAGSTNLNGITDWKVGDWAVYSGTAWQKIDNTDGVTSVNGYTGAVSLTYSDVGAPSATGTGASGTWNISVTGNAANVSGVVAVANGGTGATSLTSGYLVKGNGTSAASASVVYDTGTNVGIGTASPGYKLDVTGDIRASNYVYGTAAFIGPLLLHTGASDLAVSHSGAYSITFSTNGSERMRVNSSGNVGIGTSSPSFPLDVQSTGVGSTIAARIFRSDGTVALLRIGNSTSGSASSAPAYGSDTTAAVVYTNNTERMRIDSSGNVGIGVTNPSAKIDLAAGSGTAQVGLRIRSAAANSNGFNILTNSTTDDVSLTNFYNASIILGTNNTERMRIDSSGRVGIGVTPSAWTVTALQMASSSAIGFNNQYGEIDTNAYYNAGYKYIGTGLAAKYGQEAGVHKWFTAPSGTAGAAISFTQAMTLDASGNLGIGTSSPSYKLDVTGQARATTGVAVSTDGSTFTPSGLNAIPNYGMGFITSTSYTTIAGFGGTSFYTNQAERMRIDGSGNVGIGTASPAATFEVISNATPNIFSTNYADNTGGGNYVGRKSRGTISSPTAVLADDQLAVLLGRGYTSGGAFSANVGAMGIFAAENFTSTNNGTYITFATTATGATTRSERMRLDSAGNLGIGTASPGGGANDRSVLASGSSSAVFQTNGGSVTTQFGATSAGWGLVNVTTNNPLLLSTNSSERMRITAAGDVGIGTSSPADKLHVEGAISARSGSSGFITLQAGNSTNSGYAAFFNGSSTRVGYIGYANNSGGTLNVSAENTNALSFQTASTERMRIDNGGNVNIGAQGATGAGSIRYLDIYNTENTNSSSGADIRLITQNAAGSGTTTVDLIKYKSGAFYIANAETGSGGIIGFNTSSTERMRIDSSGNVGIGTSSPNAKLDVVGSITMGAALLTGTGLSTGDAQIELGGNRTGSGNAYIDLHATAGTDLESRIIRYGGVNGGLDILNTGTGNMILSQEGVAPLIFRTSAAERMRIDGSGNVGIGTSSPFGFSGYGWLTINGTSGSVTSLAGGGTEGFRIQYNSGSAILINAVANIPMLFFTNNTERFRITENGAWGLSGANYGSAGQVLTSNGSGSAPTWQSVSGGTVSYPQNVQSGNYTLVLSDAGKHIYSANTATQTITIPTNASVAFPIGTLITIVNMGTSQIVLGLSGVSVFANGSTTALLYPAVAPGGSIQLLKTDTNSWKGTFGTISAAELSYLSVAGGGGGGGGDNYPGSVYGGGGGAGGFVSGTKTIASGTLTVSVGAGGGGGGYAGNGAQGSNSSLTGTTTAIGGGYGGGYTNVGGSGGSGGGGSYNAAGGSGTAGQGNAGGAANGGGGGGAGGSGGGANGGNGLASTITGTSVTYAGGGGGGNGGAGGSGGGANGAVYGNNTPAGATANLGGGGAGGSWNGGAGGSGVVIISTPVAATSTTGSPTVTTSGGLTIYKFTSSGTITW